MRCLALPLVLALVLGGGALIAFAATVVPTDVQLPGTQPGETSGLESPDKCDNCHGGYDQAVEPAYNWRGSMMAQATRDPLFWATVAIAEQSFDGVGDLCIRCHSADGWLAGRSTPTDASGLNQNDAHGVSCDLCHALTNHSLIDCDDPDCGADPACAPPPSPCDGDGVCEPGEDCTTCSDCPGQTGGRKSTRYCCGNGVPEGPEGSGSICDGNH
jgi:hypothetical protein